MSKQHMNEQHLKKIAVTSLSLVTLAIGPLGCDQAEPDEWEAEEFLDEELDKEIDEASPEPEAAELEGADRLLPNDGGDDPQAYYDCDPWFDPWCEPPAATSCLVESSGGCPNYPHVTFPLYDNWNGSATNTNTCLNRAGDYGNWCGVGNNQWFRATSSGQFGEVLGSTYWAKNGCLVEIGACPNHPAMAGKTVMDTWNNAGTNQSACLARAKDYVLWCAPVNSDNYAAATYYVNTAAVAWTSARNLCLNGICAGWASDASPQSGCFSNTNTPHTKSSVLTSGGKWAASVKLDGAGNCSGYVRASISTWPTTSTGRWSEVWVEREGHGEIPGSRRAGIASFFTDLEAPMVVTGVGRLRACGTVAAGEGVGAVNGCTAWAP